MVQDRSQLTRTSATTNLAVSCPSLLATIASVAAVGAAAAAVTAHRLQRTWHRRSRKAPRLSGAIRNNVSRESTRIAAGVASGCSWHKLSRSAGFEGSLGGRDVDVRWRHRRRCSRDAGASDSEGAAVVDTVVAEGGDTVGAAAADAGASDSDGAAEVEGVTRRAGTAKLRAVRSCAP